MFLQDTNQTEIDHVNNSSNDAENISSLPKNDINNIILLDIPEVTEGILFLSNNSMELTSQNDNNVKETNLQTNYKKDLEIILDSQSTTLDENDNEDLDFVQEHNEENELQDFEIERMETEINVNKRERKKRCFVDENRWSKNINKRKRERGEAYVGKQKVDKKWKYNVHREKKVMKDRCKCKLSSKKTVLQCGIFTEDERNTIFSYFWSNLDWNQRKVYCQLLINVNDTKRHRNRLDETQSRRKSTWKYHLKKGDEKIPVCKIMFLTTLGIGERMAINWKKQDFQDKSLENESDNKRQTKDIEGRKENLRQFFREIPKTESHYCRASSAKLYLEPNWTSKSALYSLYKNTWCIEKGTNALSIAIFYKIFDEMNLSLFRPKKDECDTCATYKAGNLSQEEYTLHQEKKKEAREAKTKDKESNNKVYCMDLQSVLLSPKSNVSSLYFRTKLIVHNFTIYDMKTKDAYCYIWHESAGGVSSNDYSSIICSFLKEFVIETLNPDQHIIIYSDGCTSQNRNSNLSNALLNVAMYYKVTIEQKFLEKGHTQMEADSIHSTIEQRLRRTNINVPADYVGICLTARKNPSPYHVKYLDYTFFLNFGELKFLTSLRPGRRAGDPVVTDIRALQYLPNEHFSIN